MRVLIDASLVHQVRPLLIGVLRVPGDPEGSFEGLLELLVPLGVGDKHQLTCKEGVGSSGLCSLSARSLAVVSPRTVAVNLSSVVREEAFSVEVHQPAHRRLAEAHDLHRSPVSAQPVTQDSFSIGSSFITDIPI